jgi:O-antigen ligase
VLLTLVWFRRHELLKMAPLAAVALVAVIIISPGTIDPLLRQFRPSQLGSAAPSTTSDRAARYDAIRPDIWTHLIIGRGFGSYQPLGHRILDSQILLQTVETGVLGLASFFALAASVFLVARATIRSRDPTRAPPALGGAAAAAVFLVVAGLFDSVSFAQVPYVFLYFAGLVAVAVTSPDESHPPHEHRPPSRVWVSAYGPTRRLSHDRWPSAVRSPSRERSEPHAGLPAGTDGDPGP